MSHEYAGITFELWSDGQAHGSITVPAPRRFYYRWMLWCAAFLWRIVASEAREKG